MFDCHGKVTVLEVGREEDIDADEEPMHFILLQFFTCGARNEGFSCLTDLTDIFRERHQWEEGLRRDLPHKVGTVSRKVANKRYKLLCPLLHLIFEHPIREIKRHQSTHCQHNTEDN